MIETIATNVYTGEEINFMGRQQGTGYETDGKMYVAFIYKRILTHAEHAWLYREPYAMFRQDEIALFSAATVTGIIAGETCWGHVTDVEETNTRTFSGNWTGTGSITGSGDSERIELDAGEYMESEVVNTGAVDIELDINVYASGNTVTIKYRTSATSTMSGEWQTYTGSFNSLGYAQARVEVS